MTTGNKRGHFSEMRGRKTGRIKQEKKVRELYENAPYPDLGAGLKDPTMSFAPILNDLENRPLVNYLEAGCGTGHMLVGVAKRFPSWTCHGLDLSEASLAVARKLTDKHGVESSLHRMSYLDRLPFERESFDLISAQGTLHHCDDPTAALKNLTSYLKPDGYVSIHVYGARLDAPKFDLKEAISLFEPDLRAHAERFSVYTELARHRSRRDRLREVLDISPLDIFRGVRRIYTNFRRRSGNIVWSPPWTARYEVPTAPWADHFCHPCERAYEVYDFRELVGGARLEVAHMLKQGGVDKLLVPAALHERFDQLSNWDQWRFMELMGPASAFSAILRKARRN